MKLNFLYQIQLTPEPLTRGLPPPVPRSLCPLPSTEFVELPPPLPEQNSWVRHWKVGDLNLLKPNRLPYIPPGLTFKNSAW